MQLGIEYWINQEYVRRRNKNPAYSLRAFSRDIGISPSRLSQVLNGRRRISKKMALKVIDHLNLGPKEEDAFLKTISFKHPKEKKETAAIKKVILDQKSFELVSDPLHFAILSLCETQDFVSSNQWIAKRLKSDVISVRTAIKNLMDLGFLENSNGKLCLTHSGGVQTTDHVVSRALRKSHRQQLEHAISCLDSVALELRDFTSEFMSIDPALLPQAKVLIRKFRKKMSDLLESKEKKEVYQLSIQLVPLTQLVEGDVV